METRIIGEREFTCDVLPFGKSLEVLTRFTNLVGPSLAAAATSGEENEEGFTQAITGLLQGIRAEDLKYFADAFGTVSKCGDVNLNAGGREKIFRGHMSDFFKWLKFGFEVNFADFFADAQSLIESPPGLEKPDQPLNAQ